MRWLRCYLAMYTRLQAEEALSAVAVERAGSPFVEADAAKRIVGAWERALPHDPPKRLTPEQFAERMQMLGMERIN